MGVVVFFLAATIVSVRLLLVYWRVRQPPELFLGLGYLFAGTLGFGVLMVSVLATPPGEPVSEFYSAWSVLVGNVGSLFLYLFVWYVFRRDSAVAKGAITLVALVFAATLIFDTWIEGATFGPPPGSATTLAAAGLRGAVFLWMAAEAFREYAAFRRRARIGLGNPLVANRLFLWGCSAVASVCISIVAVGLYVTSTTAAEVTLRQNDAGPLYGLFAFVAAATLWLSFFPPRSYRAWLERSAEAEGRE